MPACCGRRHRLVLHRTGISVSQLEVREACGMAGAICRVGPLGVR